MHATTGVIFQNNKNMIIALSYLNLSIATYYKQNEAKMSYSSKLDPYSPIYSHFLLCPIYYHTSSANNHLMLLVNKTQFFKINLCHFISNSTLQRLNNTQSKLEYSHLCLTSHIFLYLSYTFVVTLIILLFLYIYSLIHKTNFVPNLNTNLNKCTYVY